MNDLVLIRRRAYGRDQYYRRRELRIELGDYCILEAERGVDYGKVMALPGEIKKEDLKKQPKKIIRVMTKEDHGQIEVNREKARNAFQTCHEKVIEKGITMKLVAAEYSFDQSRLLFYFTAEGRIDFRELVKDLAAIFKTRIELRQIGVRDEAKIRGGIGPCGLHLCCSSFLRKFDPVNIRMAKNQRQPLDTEKISGVCGRLFCCLRYEDSFYRTAFRRFPKDGDMVITPRGKGKVIDLNYIKETVLVEMEDEIKQEFSLKDVNHE
ncbi:MAG: stage 0 sporulation family protein [Candidatus Euphemobacter frigidus]|nr:stage 0 sporulation family protein [Candidatus Euphemobacter frigidus]MDP8275654.1 stage 0 sporulation family protein [Candidatus Euphemobacter frigidus]